MAKKGQKKRGVTRKNMAKALLTAGLLSGAQGQSVQPSVSASPSAMATAAMQKLDPNVIYITSAGEYVKYNPITNSFDKLMIVTPSSTATPFPTQISWADSWAGWKQQLQNLAGRGTEVASVYGTQAWDAAQQYGKQGTNMATTYGTQGYNTLSSYASQGLNSAAKGWQSVANYTRRQKKKYNNKGLSGFFGENEQNQINLPYFNNNNNNNSNVFEPGKYRITSYNNEKVFGYGQLPFRTPKSNIIQFKRFKFSPAISLIPNAKSYFPELKSEEIQPDKVLKNVKMKVNDLYLNKFVGYIDMNEGNAWTPR